MNKNEVVELLKIISAAYPGFQSETPGQTIEAWEFFLADYSLNDIKGALKIYVMTNGTNFPPTPATLIHSLNGVKDAMQDDLSEYEAWAILSKALRNSTYNSVEEFNKLPRLIQITVGSPSALRQMAIDEDYNESVARANFLRLFSERKQRQQEISHYPRQIQAEIERLNPPKVYAAGAIEERKDFKVQYSSNQAAMLDKIRNELKNITV